MENHNEKVVGGSRSFVRGKPGLGCVGVFGSYLTFIKFISCSLYKL
jgi:hypothetical protein